MQTGDLAKAARPRPRLGEADEPGIKSGFGPQYELGRKVFLLIELGHIIL